MRIASLVLSSVPFVVVAVLLVLMDQAEGSWGWLGYLILMMYGIPFLFLLSLSSVVLAFKKREKTRLDKASKVMSVTSASVFGVSSLLIVFGYLGMSGS